MCGHVSALAAHGGWLLAGPAVGVSAALTGEALNFSVGDQTATPEPHRPDFPGIDETVEMTLRDPEVGSRVRDRPRRAGGVGGGRQYRSWRCHVCHPQSEALGGSPSDRTPVTDMASVFGLPGNLPAYLFGGSRVQVGCGVGGL